MSDEICPICLLPFPTKGLETHHEESHNPPHEIIPMK